METLVKTPEVLVRLMDLTPGEIGKKHYHSQLFETVICVEGEIALYSDGNDEPILLLPGHQASVPSPVPHWLENRGITPAKYVLAQSGGSYDFVSAV